ncbi:MAG: hypothetical protein HY682_01575 [Chloroflexi bacterium]|nr:hypothetical protein [Chloroflexota bacterium]
MKKRLLLASALTLVLVGIGGSAVAWAAGSRQETPQTPPLTGNLAAMHGACVSGNAEAMQAAMNNLTEEDWQAMAAQMNARMNGGSHGNMMGGGGGGMMGSGGGMMGSGAGMMGSDRE